MSVRTTLLISTYVIALLLILFVSRRRSEKTMSLPPAEAPARTENAEVRTDPMIAKGVSPSRSKTLPAQSTPPTAAPSPKTNYREQRAPAPSAVPSLPPGYHPHTRRKKAPWIRHEKRIQHLRNEHEIDDFTKNVRSGNLAPYVGLGTSYYPFVSEVTDGAGDGLKPVELERLLGVFEGEIRFDDGKRVWQITLEINGKIEAGKLRGEATVDISDNGFTISKTSQKGELTLLKKIADTSVGILVAPNDTNLFHLYYLPERDMLAGNYYEKKSASDIVPLGAVRLPRRPVSAKVSTKSEAP